MEHTLKNYCKDLYRQKKDTFRHTFRKTSLAKCLLEKQKQGKENEDVQNQENLFPEKRLRSFKENGSGVQGMKKMNQEVIFELDSCLDVIEEEK